MLKRLTPDFHFEDERGEINQLVHEGYRQVNLVRSRAGAVRGGHFHRLNNEAFFIIEGSVRVTVSNAERTESETFSKGDMFLIEKGCPHDFEFIEDTTLIGLYDLGVELEDGSKDIIRNEG